MLTFANCKINIGLDIVNKRSDGYHDIETVMVPVGWCDAVEAIPSKGDFPTLTVFGNHIDCPDEKNLVIKAFRAMQKKHGIPNVDFFLQKNIPDGAGLGGGSSDAAHTLLLLNSMFNIGLTKDELSNIAAELGADCPFFIYNQPMLATGTGTLLTPIELNLSAFTLLIAKPSGVQISTKDAYAGVKPKYPTRHISSILSSPITEWKGCLKNDFEESIFPKAPQIAAVKDEMIRHAAIYSSMTGSGAAVYGFFNSKTQAEACQKALCDCQTWIGKL